MDYKNLIALSHYAGLRFDLVQAGGGNASVKTADGSLIIKASGFALGDVNEQQGLVALNNKKLIEILNNPDVASCADKRQREQLATALTHQAIVAGTPFRPSIETLLHAHLDAYTLHTHAIVVNAITCLPSWQEILLKLFPKALCIVYKTPGVDLALAIKDQLNGKKSQILFLQNHGLIVTAPTHEEVIFITEQVIVALEKYLAIDHAVYRFAPEIASMLQTVDASHQVVYLSHDQQLKQLLRDKRGLFFVAPFCPDTLVYCGYSSVELNGLSDIASVQGYFNRYKKLPNVLIYQNYIFCVAGSIKKAREVEDVLKFHLLALAMSSSIETSSALTLQECYYLNNWDAEKYRQQI